MWDEQRAMGAQRWSRFFGKSGNFVVEGTSLKDAFLRWERAGWGMAVVWLHKRNKKVSCPQGACAGGIGEEDKQTFVKPDAQGSLKRDATGVGSGGGERTGDARKGFSEEERF